MTARLSRAAILALVLLGVLGATGARAEAAAEERGWFDRYNRAVFAFNGAFGDGMAWLGRQFGGAETVPEPSPPGGRRRGGFGNMLSNLVNEPITVLASLAVGDLEIARTAARRLAINSTEGFLGWYDRATARGLLPRHADVGLALCRYGVGEGGYMVLPFIGPRTIRDAVADVALVNAVLWSTVGILAGSGASFQTIFVAEAVEIAADIVATRQIDPKAKALGTRDYDATREAYLEQRRARCADSLARSRAP
ncbi:MlaA family lipoprotein [Stella sp.]|uniref:MlaA family lipoprotein n=1 Tax=Stella sp. TaxID=2912054 RepID=UPI0035B10A84